MKVVEKHSYVRSTTNKKFLSVSSKNESVIESSFSRQSVLDILKAENCIGEVRLLPAALTLEVAQGTST